MILESIYHGDKEYAVVLTEIINTERLTKDALLALSTQTPEDIMAVQFLRADIVPGVIYLISVAQNALNAWLGEYARARSLAVELLLYASAQHQIGVAIEQVGVANLPEDLVIVVVGENRTSVRAYAESVVSHIGRERDRPFEQNEQKFRAICEHFGVPMNEIQTITEADTLEARFTALTKCIVSRVSLVAFDT